MIGFLGSPFNFAAAGSGGDPDFASVSLLLPLNGTNGGTSFPDESNNNFTVTGFGNAQTTTAQSQWAGSSLVLDGSSDYLSVPDNAAFDFGSGDFTIEFWLRWNSLSGFQTIYDHGYTGSGALLLQTGNGDGRIGIYTSGSYLGQESGSPSTRTWIFYQIVRSGTSLRINRNGTSSLSVTNSTSLGSTANIGIGARLSAGTLALNGWMQDLRVTKGIARSNVVPTAAFPTF